MTDSWNMRSPVTPVPPRVASVFEATRGGTNIGCSRTSCWQSSPHPASWHGRAALRRGDGRHMAGGDGSRPGADSGYMCMPKVRGRANGPVGMDSQGPQDWGSAGTEPVGHTPSSTPTTLTERPSEVPLSTTISFQPSTISSTPNRTLTARCSGT